MTNKLMRAIKENDEQIRVDALSEAQNVEELIKELCDGDKNLKSRDAIYVPTSSSDTI